MWWLKKQKFVSGVLDDDRPLREKNKDYKTEEILTSPYPLSWITWEEWREKPKNKRMLAEIEVNSQNQVGSCAAQAGSLALAINNYLEEGRFIKFSAKPVYARRSNKPKPGMYMHDLGNICVKHGTVFEAVYPTPNTTEEAMSNLDGWLPSFDGIAKILKAENYFWLENNIDWYASILNKDKPIVLALKFGDNDKWNSAVPIVSNNVLKFGHAICCIPEAFFFYQGKKAILIQDSHGANVGMRGRKILTEDWFVHKRVFQGIWFEDLNNLAVLNKEIEKPKLKLVRNLEVGDRGFDVAQLQRCLGYLKDAEGYLFPLTQAPTGIFGGITRQAIKRFQKKYELEITGKVNELTREKLNSIFV